MQFVDCKHLWVIKKKKQWQILSCIQILITAVLFWHFSSKKSQNKMERIHERSLKLLSNDYLSSYAECLEKSTSVSMETKKLRRIIYEIFKTLNNLNPVFMTDIFHYSANVTHKRHNLYIHT